MTDATDIADHQGLAKADKSTIPAQLAPQATAAAIDTRPQRPARPDEIGLVHKRLMEAIWTSPHYSNAFKQFETRRLTKVYLRSLMAVDPRHIMILLAEGKPAGLMISGPELGKLWLYWTYVFPECRQQANVMSFMRAFTANWDNDRFHKIATYTRPGNDVAIVMMRRFKYQHIVTHENHMFGEDFMLFERPLNKAIEGYDSGLSTGFLGRLKYRLLAMIGR